MSAAATGRRPRAVSDAPSGAASPCTASGLSVSPMPSVPPTGVPSLCIYFLGVTVSPPVASRESSAEA